MNGTTEGPRVAIATCAAFAELTPDDGLLTAALAASGAQPEVVVWDDATVAWSAYDSCLVRSVWDYHFKLDRFLAWAQRAGRETTLCNPPELLAWNADKSYLRQLAARGVPTIPTEWIARGSDAQLAEVLAARGWGQAVIKPTVDLGALNLRRVEGNGIDQIALEGLLTRGDVMVQPYLPSIETAGETSLIYLGGELSHTVRKRPAAGDYRVQPTWGGSVGAEQPTPSEQGVAIAALAALDAEPLYARTDMVAGPAGEPLLIELELIDPHLFLAEAEGAAERLATACLR